MVQLVPRRLRKAALVSLSSESPSVIHPHCLTPPPIILLLLVRSTRFKQTTFVTWSSLIAVANHLLLFLSCVIWSIHMFHFITLQINKLVLLSLMKMSAMLTNEFLLQVVHPNLSSILCAPAGNPLSHTYQTHGIILYGPWNDDHILLTINELKMPLGTAPRQPKEPRDGWSWGRASRAGVLLWHKSGSDQPWLGPAGEGVWGFQTRNTQ